MRLLRTNRLVGNNESNPGGVGVHYPFRPAHPVLITIRKLSECRLTLCRPTNFPQDRSQNGEGRTEKQASENRRASSCRLIQSSIPHQGSEEQETQ